MSRANRAIATFPALLERFFTDHLMQQRRVSSHTITAYRDSFRLLLRFAQQRLRKSPSNLELTDLGADLIVDFLKDMERSRSIGARTRNLRLAAIRSFFRFVSFHAPMHAGHIQRVLAIPAKRHDRPEIAFLTRREIDALLAVPDQSTWLGRRDYALLLLTVQTGLRLSELTALTRDDVCVARGAHVRCRGKGRKERSVPLALQTAAVLRTWLRESSGPTSMPLFPSLHGSPLSADAVQRLLAKHIAAARTRCPSLARKRVSPHVLRHSAAMALLQAGVDSSVIALWLGHESIETTQVYLHAHLGLKESALARIEPIAGKLRRFQPGDHLLQFLEAL